MSKHVLVAYGSKRGGTAGIANAIADCLRQDGCTVDCKAAGDVDSLAGYDAAIIGGALYMGRWHRDAWRFAVRHAERLRELPVWLFSSGPLDHSAAEGEISPTGQVARLMARIGARGHITFGGRLTPDAKGFIAAAMAKKHAGDWRDWSQIRAWACEIATQIQVALPEEPAITIASASPVGPRWSLVALCAFVAISAITGGALLVARPDGALLNTPAGMLAPSGFSSFLVPGLLLMLIIGAGNALAAGLVATRRRFGTLGAFTAGTALVVWITSEMILLRTVHWLQLGYLAVGVSIVALAVRAARLAERGAADRVSADRNRAFAG